MFDEKNARECSQRTHVGWENGSKEEEDEEALSVLPCIRYIFSEMYDLNTISDDVGLFSAKLSVQSWMTLNEKFRKILDNQNLKARFNKSCFGFLRKLPKFIKFNGTLVHHTLLHRAKENLKENEI